MLPLFPLCCFCCSSSFSVSWYKFSELARSTNTLNHWSLSSNYFLKHLSRKLRSSSPSGCLRARFLPPSSLPPSAVGNGISFAIPPIKAEIPILGDSRRNSPGLPRSRGRAVGGGAEAGAGLVISILFSQNAAGPPSGKERIFPWLKGVSLQPWLSSRCRE